MTHLFVVTSGIKPGEKILLEGLRKVKNNQHIEFEMESPEKVLSDLNHLHAE
jgi:membrane fusion protein, multidrug efflux system